jgi:hypothetical protein
VIVDVEGSNAEQIERLNQRGGRTLSIVDLIQAGTLNAEMAACGMRAMAEGVSILTAARPGGAGKTTLMAAFLHLLPPGVRIVTVDRPGVVGDALGRAADEPLCYLAHEIGSGHWYGYIWGPTVADFLALIAGPRRVASCLHADTLDELRGIVCSPPLGASAEALGRVGLVLFMHVRRGLRGIRRRVAAFHHADGAGGHRLLYRWDERSDSFERPAEPPDPQGLRPYLDFIEGLVGAGAVDCRSVRRRALSFYDNSSANSEGVVQPLS